MRAIRKYAFLTMAALTIFSSVPAKASILLEPYLGYEFGKHDTSSTSLDFSSAVLGARLAYEFPVIFVGLDYMTPIGGTAKATIAGATTNFDVTGSALYADVGFQLPMIRGYVGYALMHDETFKANGSSSKLEGGSAFKIGVGTTILPAVAINLEYLNATYDKSNGNSFSPNDKENYYMLAVSLPFSF